MFKIWRIIYLRSNDFQTKAYCEVPYDPIWEKFDRIEVSNIFSVLDKKSIDDDCSLKLS